jgi:hypothetical protein
VPTPSRNVRVEDELWEGAILAATEEGTTVAAVIRDALERFVEDHEATVNKAGVNA